MRLAIIAILVLGSALGVVIGGVSVLKPLRFLGIRTRLTGVLVALLSVGVFISGVAWAVALVPESTKSRWRAESIERARLASAAKTSQAQRRTEPSGTVSASSAESGAEQSAGDRRMGTTFKVGYTSFNVADAWWSETLSENEILDRRPNAAFLFVRMTVQNADRKARMIPPIKLVDEVGAEYEASHLSAFANAGINSLESLNPGVAKTGVVVFDVPRAHSYRLQLSGGYWSGKDASVPLTIR